MAGVWVYYVHTMYIDYIDISPFGSPVEMSVALNKPIFKKQISWTFFGKIIKLFIAVTRVTVCDFVLKSTF